MVDGGKQAFRPIEKPAPKPTEQGGLEAPQPPPGASAEERLLYPPGLLGHVVQHIVDVDMFPDRRMANWAGICALGKAVDRKVIGPTGSSTLLFLILLAATAAGKQNSHDSIRILLRAMGLEKLIQAGGLASVQGTEDIVRHSPNSLVLIDEFGRWLRMILDQTSNVRELPGTLCKFWAIRPGGSWPITRRARETTTTITLPGTELAFAHEVKCQPTRLWPWHDSAIKHKTAIFHQINKDKVATHHDALEFPDGQIVLLTSLGQGQQANSSSVAGGAKDCR